MIEETIKELCRLVKIPEEALLLYDRTNVQFIKETPKKQKKRQKETRKEGFRLHHYKTEHLEGITISCIQDDDIEADVISYPEDSTYLMEIKIKTYCLFEIQALAKKIPNSSKTFQKAKTRIHKNAFPCDNPYDTQVIVPIECNEQKEAASFAYKLISDYAQCLADKEKQEQEAKKTRGRNYSTAGPKEID